MALFHSQTRRYMIKCGISSWSALFARTRAILRRVKSSQNFIQDPLTEGMRIIQHTNKTHIKTNDEQLSSTHTND